MKRTILALASLLISFHSFAQVGIVGGFTSTTTSIVETIRTVQNQDLKNFHAGITYKCPLILGFAIQPSLIYNVKGAVKEIADFGSIDYKTGYLELPIQVQWGPDLTLVRPYAFVEPFIGYALHTNGTVKANAGNIPQKADNAGSRFEYGAGLGIGIEIIKHIQVSARYYWNLGNLYEFTNIGEEIQKIQINNCKGIQVSAAVLF